MKFCYNTNVTLPRQSQRSRSVSQDGSRSLGLFRKEKNSSYNQRNTVIQKATSQAAMVRYLHIVYFAHLSNNSRLYQYFMRKSDRPTVYKWHARLKCTVLVLLLQVFFFLSPGKQTGSHESCFPLKNGVKDGMYPETVKSRETLLYIVLSIHREYHVNVFWYQVYKARPETV